MKQPSIASFGLAACVLALTGCASPTPSPSGTTPPALAADHSVNFPDMDKAWLKGGTFVDVEQLRRIHTGMTKNQVRELISYPHFSEGLFGPREWNYIFNFRTGKGQEYITCQYMVHFDDDVRSQDFHWKGPNCEAMLNPPAAATPVPAAAVAPVATVPSRKVTLGADGLFRFDGGKASDLLPEGRRKIERLAADIRERGEQVLINVVGHTDRLGAEAYNSALSLQRANTVRDLLAQQGLPTRTIRAAGAGEQQPVVQCQGDTATPQLVSCLQPNRRVEIEVISGR